MTHDKPDRDEQLRALSDQLEQSVAALVTGQDWLNAMAFAERFRERSFSNTLLVYAQHAAAFEEGRVPEPYPTHVAGFNQWKAMGRHVSRRQAGYRIMAPVTARQARPDDNHQWRTLPRGERPGAGEQVRSKIVTVKPAYVWDISQTEGPDPVGLHPPAPQLLAGQAPEGLWESLESRVSAQGFRVSTVASSEEIGGANGVTDFAARTVLVRADVDAAQKVKTLAHELGHVLLHDPQRDGQRPAHRGIGEVEAESFAFMIASNAGIDTSAYTVPYVATWAARTDPLEQSRLVRETGDRVRKAAGRVLDEIDPRPVLVAAPGAGPRSAPKPRPGTRAAGFEHGRVDIEVGPGARAGRIETTRL